MNSTQEVSDQYVPLAFAASSVTAMQRHVGDLYWPSKAKAESLCSEAATALRAIWLGGGYATVVFGAVGHVFFAIVILAHSDSVSIASARSSVVAPLGHSNAGTCTASFSGAPSRRAGSASSGQNLRYNIRPMRTLPIGVLLLSMAAVAMAMLGVDIMPTVLDYQTCSFFWLGGSFGAALRSGLAAEVGCRVQLVLRHTLPCLHAWLEAAVCLERLAAVRWPHKYATLFDRRRTLWFVAGVAGLLLFVTFVPVATHEPIDEGLCEPINVDLFELSWRRLRSLVLAAAPIAIVLPSSVLTMQTLLAGGGHADVAVSHDERRTSLAIAATSALYLVGLALLAVADWRNYGLEDVSRSIGISASAAVASTLSDLASEILNSIGRMMICLCGLVRFAACAALCEPFRDAFESLLARSAARCRRRRHRLSQARLVGTARDYDASRIAAASGQGSSDRTPSAHSKSAGLNVEPVCTSESTMGGTESTALDAPESTAACSTVDKCPSTVNSAMTSTVADESATEINMDHDTAESDLL